MDSNDNSKNSLNNEDIEDIVNNAMQYVMPIDSDDSLIEQKSLINGYEKLSSSESDDMTDTDSDGSESEDSSDGSDELDESNIDSKLFDNIDDINKYKFIEDKKKSVRDKVKYYESLHSTKYRPRKLSKLRKMVTSRRKYMCNECNIIFPSGYALNDHNTYTHPAPGFIANRGHCRCVKCNLFFETEYKYRSHKCSGVPSDVDNIPTNPDGEFFCPSCGNRYTTPNLLGEHFINSHNSYDDIMALDLQSEVKGFPGFELLEIIGMIDEIDPYQDIKYGRKCPICFRMYKLKESPYEQGTLEDIDQAYSDSELEVNRDTLLDHCKSIYINRKKRKIKLRDIRLIEWYNKDAQREKLPVEMTCCNQRLCYDCLEQYLTINNFVICPFCNKDHTREDWDYVTICEIDDNIDSSKWQTWWTNHLHIFY